MPAGRKAVSVSPPDFLKKFGFPASCRVRKSWEYTRVYTEGRRLPGKGFTLLIAGHDTVAARLGVSIHRKIKGACLRNRFKRIFREAFRLHREVFPASGDIVVAVRPDCRLDSPLAIVQAVRALGCRHD